MASAVDLPLPDSHLQANFGFLWRSVSGYGIPHNPVFPLRSAYCVAPLNTGYPHDAPCVLMRRKTLRQRCIEAQRGKARLNTVSKVLNLLYADLAG